MDPAFLTLKIGGNAARWAEVAADARCTVLAAGDVSVVRPLEHGTTHSGIVILRFPFRADLDDFWNRAAVRELVEVDHELVALAAAGLPWEGWPGHFVPTIATVDVPASDMPRTFMLIEGTGTDQDRMDAYRDQILPMMRDRGAYYVAFELGGNVQILAGQWNEGIFAISRWPSRALAEDFWYSDHYQNHCIPLRTGVGRFDVQIVEGVSG